jgi:hypothetical protein
MQPWLPTSDWERIAVMKISEPEDFDLAEHLDTDEACPH